MIFSGSVKLGVFQTMNLKTFYLDIQTLTLCRPKKSTAIRGSGGVTVFVKDWLIKRGFIKRIFDHITESVVLLIDAKSNIHVNDIILIFTYVSPEYSSIYSNEDNNGIEILNTNISQIKGNYPNAELFLAGDLNSRIKNLNDFVLDDNLLFIFGDDVPYPEDDFNMPRLSKDTEFNRFGLSFIELCCTYGIHVFNGRLFDDIHGNYTCLANNGASVVDYMAATTSLFKNVTYFKIDDNDESVHFPIICHFSFPTILNLNNHIVDSEENMSPWLKYKWKPELKDIFVNKLTSEFQQFNEHTYQFTKPNFVFVPTRFY